eukprot:SM000227S07447  [mRNA]  locus=s227:88731:91740:+ [translate_table: standard]
MAAAGGLISRCAAGPLASLGGLALLRRPSLLRQRGRSWTELLAALLVSPTRRSPRSPPLAAHERCRPLPPGPCLAALDELASSSSSSSSGTGVAAGRPEVHTGPLEEQQPRRRKKKVAIWIGYVGTDFKAVEGELEKAILAADAMLPSNFGDFAKSKWGRSSRTDKGVHSVATVVGMKMEVPYDAWVGDEDGARLAASINEHLTSSIRVFSVQPVNKSFLPRRACRERTYHYLIPASALEIDAGTAPHEVNNRLNRLRAILASFEGKHPFHNYTSRSNYRPVQYCRQTAVAPPVAPEHTPQSSGNWDYDPASASVGEHQEFGGKRSPAAPENLCTREALTRQSRIRDSDLLDEDGDMPKPSSSEDEDEVLDIRSRRFDRKTWWVQQPDATDKIFAAHYRIVKECSCAHLEDFQGCKFARVVIVGESFMIYQIRKMMGTAIATLRGVLSPDILPVSLARHSRIPLPLAPAEGLVLTGSIFFPLRQQAPKQIASDDTVSVSLSAQCDWGQALVKLSPRAQEEADTFLAANVLTAMAASLTVDKAPWKVWLERLHEKPWLGAEDVQSLIAAFTSWQVAVQSRKDVQAY